MSTFLRNTTSSAVSRALINTRRAGGGCASGQVLTLLVSVRGDDQDAAVEAAIRTAAEHPSRILVVNHRPTSSPSRLDAEVFGSGERGPGELVVLDLHGELAAEPNSVALPLLVPDTPVVTYWPAWAPEAPCADPLGALSQRRITDLAGVPDAPTRLRRLCERYSPGDTDLSWTRLTPWRSLLAAALDQDAVSVTGGSVAAEPGNPSALLLAAWLTSRLGGSFDILESPGPGLTEVRLATDRGEIAIRRTDGRLAMLRVPGWPERPMALKRRGLAELIAEELRRLDPDDIYAECLQTLRAGCPAEVGRPSDQPREQEGRMTGTVIVHRDAELLAGAAAARLVTRLVDVQSARGAASLVLTGGGVGIATLAQLARMPARDAIDWRNLDIWWGDERFLPGGHPDRNETQARAALLDHVSLDPERVHPMPASDGPYGDDPEAAAAAYAKELGAASRPEDHGPAPTFDVLLLGVGPDGHVASLFPEKPALYEEERAAVAVRGAPKPPPIRITLTLPAIRCAAEVWLLAAGTEKAPAVHLALSGAGPVQIPAAGARGRSRTLWLLDRAAAAQVPPTLPRPASP